MPSRPRALPLQPTSLRPPLASLLTEERLRPSPAERGPAEVRCAKAHRSLVLGMLSAAKLAAAPAYATAADETTPTLSDARLATEAAAAMGLPERA